VIQSEQIAPCFTCIILFLE